MISNCKLQSILVGCVPFFVCVLFFPIGVCQELTPIEAVEGSFVGEYRSNIPDPNSPLSIAVFATQPAIAEELKMPRESSDQLQHLLEQSGGSLSIFSIPTKKDGIRFSREHLKEFAEAKRDDNLIQLISILNPDQLNRLSQVVRQIEIHRVGLREAMVHGHLGKAANVQDYQKPAMLITLESLEKKFKSAMIDLYKKRDMEILHSISEEQRSTFEKLLGVPFHFVERKEFGRQSWSDKNEEGILRNYCIPNPEVKQELVSLLVNESIRVELSLTELDLEEVLGRLRSLRNSLLNPEIPFSVEGRRTTKEERLIYHESSLRENKEIAERALDPLQTDRLKQLAYRVEMARLGVGNAFIFGRLGEKMGVKPTQHDAIRIACDKADADFTKGMTELMGRVYAEAFGVLDPSQRAAAEQAIGKPFLYQSNHWKKDDFLKH